MHDQGAQNFVLREQRDDKNRVETGGERCISQRKIGRLSQIRNSDRVTLLGQRWDVYDLHAAADIFVMPSLWEGLPLALLEAMHAGTAIVASRTSGIPEAITDGVDGLLTPPGDEVALRDALVRLLPDASERARLGAAALARARSKFSLDRMTDEYEALYRTPK